MSDKLKSLDPCGSDSSTLKIASATVVEILPKRIWIESDMMGSRHVVMHHQGFGEPFTFASFHYNYAYTSNAGTWEAAQSLALSLGATEPVEHRYRGPHVPSADELREEIKLMQEALADMEAANTTSNARPPNDMQSPGGDRSSERPTDRPAPKLSTELSHRQRELMKWAPEDWAELPTGVGCTNATLAALERRGLVETRIDRSKRLHWTDGWQWRKARSPGAELTRSPEAQRGNDE